jgi:hypothetical protein
MLLTSRLDPHLAEIDQNCEEQLEFIIRQMALQEDVTEALKAADQMEWCAARTASEIVRKRSRCANSFTADEGVKIIEPRGSNTTFYRVFIRRYCYNIVRMLYYIKILYQNVSTPL